MYSAYKLNKQGDNIQPWHTLFPILSQFIVPCLILTVASWPACRFIRKQIWWSSIPISWRIFQFVVIHTDKGFHMVNETEVDVFLEFFCFFYDQVDVFSLISGGSAFLNLASTYGISQFTYYWSLAWKVLSIILLIECKCMVVWMFFGIALLWDWNENWPVLVLWPLLSFLDLLTYWVQPFNSIIF